MDPSEDLDSLPFSDDEIDMELEHNSELFASADNNIDIDLDKPPSPAIDTTFAASDAEDLLASGVHQEIPWHDGSKIVERWLQMYQDGVFTVRSLREFWRVMVPPNFCPHHGQNCMEPLFDESRVNSELINPLENFICGNTSGDTDKVWENLSKNDYPPALCGRVFRMGEPTYSCRDCGADPTCVLCVDCFRNSEHKLHRYKLSTSVGGGYCDCGDAEAWRSAPRCSLHQSDSASSALLRDPEARKKAALDRLDRIVSPNMADRCRIVMEAVLKYAQELLGSDSSLNLPSDLKVKDMGGSLQPLGRRSTFGPEYGSETYNSVYVTAVYNDESHTFEQVIQALQRSLEVGTREAVDLATCIDREGRSIVRCASFQVCNQARQVIERNTSRLPPRMLKVCVLLGLLLAHQSHALRLLHWLRKLMGICEGFRLLLADVIMKPISLESEFALLECVLLSDTQLWKAARSAWHRLFIAGLLMDPDAKRDFAQIFTRHYGQLMCDFISDDHDHSHSVTSLSVQLFTVPTLAQYLTAYHDALAALLRCFLQEIDRRKNNDGRLSFDRSPNQSSFRRAMYVLYDIKYLLSAVPLPEISTAPGEELINSDEATSGRWSDALRKGFLHGLQMLLSLLASMEGMDSVIRQTGQHVEFEAEWENAFNLHCKLAPVLTLIVRWCASDKKVLLKSTRAALKKFQELQPVNQVPNVSVSLLGHSQFCYEYDVSSQPVSVHLPLSRLISGLLLALPKHGLSWDSSELELSPKPTLLQLMEAPLRIQVLMAQVQAGMWRRNGYSLINQLYFYQNVRCRTEMYDRDIVLLQLCAALMGANSFLIGALHRFNLLNWAREDFDQQQQQLLNQQSASIKGQYEEDNLRQTVSIAEEFLRLIIILSQERFTPGIGQVDEDECLSHEVLHLLCVEPQGHAALNRALPEDAHHETGLERVADRVAVFRKPTQGTGRGVFSLRPELYTDYNVYHYHYSREDQSRSEDNVRKIRRSKNEEDCCPPPLPVALASPVQGLANLLNCEITMHLIQQVLRRTSDLRSRNFSESQLQAVLHIVGLALREEERKQRDKSRPSFEFSIRGQNHFQLLALLESLQTNGRVDAHRPLLSWTIRKYRNILSTAQSTSEGPSTSAETEAAEGSGQETEAETAARKRKAELAAARRAAILAQMSAQQKNFLKENAQLFQDAENEMNTSASVMKSGLRGSTMDLSEGAGVSETFPVCIGPEVTPFPGTPDPSYTCIVCQEEQRPAADQPAIVLAAFVQRSTVLRWFSNQTAIEEPLPDIWPLLIDGRRRIGTHVSTCGHVMHAQCWQLHFDSLLGRERRRSYRPRQSSSFDVERQEFLCPLCKGLSNAILPILPNQQQPVRIPGSEHGLIDMNTWLEGLYFLTENSHGEKYQKYEGIIWETVSVPVFEKKMGPMKSKLFLNELEQSSRQRISANLQDMASLFAQCVYTTSVATNPHSEVLSVPMLISQAAAFTILSTDALLVYQNHSPATGLAARQEEGLRALLRFIVAMESVVTSKEVSRSYVIQILRTLLLPSSTTSIVDIDAFGVLVGLLTSLPCLGDQVTDPDEAKGIPQFNPILAWHIFRLCLLCHLTQILLSNSVSDPMEVDHLSSEEWRNFTQLIGHHFQSEQDVAVQCLPFLRSSAMLFHFLTGISFPKLDEVYDSYAEALLWLRYLGVKSLENIVKEQWVKQLVQTWIGGLSQKVWSWNFPVSSPGLINLPSDYSELINAASLFTCPNSEGDEARTPAMCLVCGKLLCSQSYCCQIELDGQHVGACTAHSQICGLGACLFLRVRECKLLLMAGKNKGCFVPPPYVDVYGETDQGLRRGDPLHLCDASRRKLELIWRSHGLYNEAAKHMENSQALVVTDWHHL